MVSIARAGHPICRYAAVRTDDHRAALGSANTAILEELGAKLGALVLALSNFRFAHRGAAGQQETQCDERSAHSLNLAFHGHNAPLQIRS